MKRVAKWGATMRADGFMVPTTSFTWVTTFDEENAAAAEAAAEDAARDAAANAADTASDWARDEASFAQGAA